MEAASEEFKYASELIERETNKLHDEIRQIGSIPTSTSHTHPAPPEREVKLKQILSRSYENIKEMNETHAKACADYLKVAEEKMSVPLALLIKRTRHSLSDYLFYPGQPGNAPKLQTYLLPTDFLNISNRSK